jgi:hypothetical protein
VLLAAALLRDQISGVMADARGLSYESVPPNTDALFLPGALKYGGLGGLAALVAPTKLEIFGTEGIPAEELAPLTAAYKAAGGSLATRTQPLMAEMVAGRFGK